MPTRNSNFCVLFPVSFLLATTLASSPILAGPISTDDPGMDNPLNAKVARMKAKAKSIEGSADDKDGTGSAGKASECGHVDIGNTEGGRSTRNQTVIITEPIINVAKCRRF